MKLTREDIQKYGTGNEKKLLEKSIGPTERELLIAIGKQRGDFDDSYGSGQYYLKSVKQVGNQVVITAYAGWSTEQDEILDMLNDEGNPNFVSIKPGKEGTTQVIITYNIPKDKLKIHSMSGADAAIKLKELEKERRILNKKIEKLNNDKDVIDSKILALRNRAKRK
jgi:hypothetical protein